MPVPRFLRFTRLARFRPSWPFCRFLLFRLVISPYQGDGTCPFHVFPGLHVLAVMAVFAVPAGDFTRFGWSACDFTVSLRTEHARSTFPLFSLAYTLPPFADSDTTLGHIISFWAFKPPFWYSGSYVPSRGGCKFPHLMGIPSWCSSSGLDLTLPSATKRMNLKIQFFCHSSNMTIHLPGQIPRVHMFPQHKVRLLGVGRVYQRLCNF